MHSKPDYHRLKKSILFLIALLLIHFSFAQKNHFSLSVNGIGNNNYLLKEDANQNLQLKSTFIIGPGSELLYGHDLSDSFTFQTGLFYQYRQYYDLFIDYYRYGELAIPAIISFHVTKKPALKLDWSTGIYFNRLIHMKWFERSSGTWYDETHFLGGINPTKFGLDFYSDVKLRFPVSIGREIFIAPFLLYHLTKKNYYKGMTFQSLGLKIGYTFKSF